jgi:hypothetical protein
MVRNSTNSPLGSELGYPTRKRDTAAACRDKARDNLMQARHLRLGKHRTLLQQSAAAWSVRADQRERQEVRATLDLLSVPAAAKRH